MFRVTYGSSSKLCIQKGLVVPEDSVVHEGLSDTWAPLSNEESTNLFKQLLGIRRKKQDYENEEEPEQPRPKQKVKRKVVDLESESEASDDESSEAFEDSDEMADEDEDDDAAEESDD
jgi:hypothetical protein